MDGARKEKRRLWGQSVFQMQSVRTPSVLKASDVDCTTQLKKVQLGDLDFLFISLQN